MYDGYGAVLTGTMPVTLTQTLLDMPDGTTGLVYQGNGRYYDPTLGRPLQPNPAGAPPTVPQALNRYAATPMGQPGVFQTQASSLIDKIMSPVAWAGVVGNTSLEIAGRQVIVSPSRLVLRGGSIAALENALGGKNIPFTTRSVTKGGWLGSLAIGASGYIPFVGTRIQNHLIQRWVSYEARTGGYYSLITALRGGRYRFNQLGTTVDIEGLALIDYQSGKLLKDAVALRTFTSVGLTAGIDIAFELYGYATETGRWANPYWTKDQKIGQAFFVIGSDVALAGTLAFVGFNWYWAIPAAFIWAVFADDAFAAFPPTAPLYTTHRMLQPLESN
ncbi:MAG: hypothetical protein KA314_24480 [Chloroflexi bacterium]|nr:hypothetical protein [Chloroflexota bacterium]MBP8059003.1 hypothetical protein [Chloroflexota bacterium]